MILTIRNPWKLKTRLMRLFKKKLRFFENINFVKYGVIAQNIFSSSIMLIKKM